MNAFGALKTTLEHIDQRVTDRRTTLDRFECDVRDAAEQYITTVRRAAGPDYIGNLSPEQYADDEDYKVKVGDINSVEEFRYGFPANCHLSHDALGAIWQFLRHEILEETVYDPEYFCKVFKEMSYEDVAKTYGVRPVTLFQVVAHLIENFVIVSVDDEGTIVFVSR